jgi:hypothetical protein
MRRQGIAGGVLAGTLLMAPGAWAEGPDRAASGTDWSRHRGILTVRGAWHSGVPDYYGPSLTVTAIPVVDVELGASAVLPLVLSGYLRVGPRWSLYEGRSAEGRGLSLRLSALGGVRGTAAYVVGADARQKLGLNAVAALDGTYWVWRHFGFSAQLVAGGTAYLPLQGPWQALMGPLTPDVRFALGVAF